ncbi:hypothetical protein [Actinoplanes sichuanensis]|uniref:hypothetical protein n=1 Tax=Actinoplanes sichuanensis TaxID=512349 RepID=UPI002953AA63|nr:hypothetical protein [Actinoplanes sichuanensis]
MKAASPGVAGCLSLVGLCLSPVVGSTLAMPATALYVSRHHPAELAKSDHWLLFACLALPLAGLIALWTARNRGRLPLTVTVRTVTLLLAAFVVTTWTLEHYVVPVELLSFVPILTGWGAILVLLMLIPLLNRAFPAPLRERPAPTTRPASRSRSSTGDQRHRSRRTDSPRRSPSPRRSTSAGRRDGRAGYRSRDGRPEYRSRDARTENRSRDGRAQNRSRDGQPEYRSRDGQPEYRKERPEPRPGDGAPRYRNESVGRPPQQPRQGDGKPRYRAEPPPPRRPSGDGKPVYRDD